MAEKTRKINRLQDYKPSNYFIPTTNLFFDIQNDATTIVKAKLSICKNTIITNSEEKLTLIGRNMELLGIKINGQKLSEEDYSLQNEELIINTHNLENEFCLETKVKILPQNNTELMGLYKSGNNLVTQCEAFGFERITYYLDRPDILSIFTTTIAANSNDYPVLLSNGNNIKNENCADNRTQCTWYDPYPKPAYLFAIVAGKLEYLEDHFITKSNRKIQLRIYAEKQNIQNCNFAMDAVKKSMQWDEENYQREYDLDLFMIVAISDFNMGAMENKGLNIFNDKYIMANKNTTTDMEYFNVARVIGHEYFHNWTGNRVTICNWFQLTQKEGLTVFREQEFCESLISPAVATVDRAKTLQERQFSEDESPMAHPIRPIEYIEMNNFYTSTVYEKGAAVVRMLTATVGPNNFRKYMNNYFLKFDAQAISTEDFINFMADEAKIDLTQFKLWYSQAGTPNVQIEWEYIAEKQELILNVRQFFSERHPNNKPFFIPLVISFLNEDGKEIDINIQAKEQDIKLKPCILFITESDHQIRFNNVKQKLLPSFNDNFTAPIIIKANYSEKELSLLFKHHNDAFIRWHAGQELYINSIRNILHEEEANIEQILQPLIINFKYLFGNLKQEKDIAFIAKLMQFPNLTTLQNSIQPINIHRLYEIRNIVCKKLAQNLSNEFMQTYQNYQEDNQNHRALKNICLEYLNMLDNEQSWQINVAQYFNADNMTDRLATLNCIVKSENNQARVSNILQNFYDKFSNQHLVVNQWLMLNALRNSTNIIDEIKAITESSAFNWLNPNKIFSLIYSYAKYNIHFHQKNGNGYKFLSEIIIKLNNSNTSVAARLLSCFENWQDFIPEQQKLMQENLVYIQQQPNLSNAVFEIVDKYLSVNNVNDATTTHHDKNIDDTNENNLDKTSIS